MAILRAILIDDTQSHRNRIRRVINDHLSSKISIVAEASNLKEGIDLIVRYIGNFDVLILDMWLNVSHTDTGFQLLDEVEARVKGKIPFSIIAITVDSSKWGVDWSVNIKKYPDFVGLIVKWTYKGQSLADQFKSVIIAVQKESVLIKNLKNESSYVSVKNIIYIESYKGYTALYLSSVDRKLVSKCSLGYFNDSLSKDDFFFTHSSHIVNINEVDKLRNPREDDIVKPKGGFAIMKNGEEVKISTREKREELKGRIKGRAFK